MVERGLELIPFFKLSSRERLMRVLERQIENERRAGLGLPSVGEGARRTAARLREKYPGDEWLETAEKIAEEEKEIDRRAARLPSPCQAPWN